MRGDGEDPETSDPGTWKRLALGLYPDAGASLAAPDCLSLCSRHFNCDTNCHFCCRAGGNEAIRLLGRGFPESAPASRHGTSQCCAQGS